MPHYYGMSVVEILLRLGAAIVVGAVIGVEREHKNRPAGMRTHVLVCVGACVVALIECCLAEQSIGQGLGFNMGRIAAQVISGIGFLGAGTILTARKKVTGLTTAASVWNVACLGLASGYGYYLIALLGCAIVMAVLLLMQRIVHVNTIKKVEIRFIHRVETLNFINQFFDEKKIEVMDIDFNVENKEPFNIYTNLYELHLPGGYSYTEMVNQLSEFANVQSVHTRNV